MKNIMKIYFGSDIASAVFALIVFVCTVTMLVSHLYMGAGALSFFVETIFCIMGWNLMAAVYDENKKDLSETEK